MTTTLGLHAKGKTVFPVRWLGSTFALVWMWLVLFGNQSVTYSWEPRLAFMAGFALALVALWLAPASTTSSFARATLPLSCAVLAFATFVLCGSAEWRLFDVDGGVLLATMGVAGFCLALILCSWMRLRSQLKVDAMTITALLSLLLSAALYYALWIVKPAFWGVGWMALPLCSLLAFHLSSPHERADARPALAGEPLVLQRGRLRTRVAFLAVVFVLVGFAYGTLGAAAPSGFAFVPVGMGIASLAAVFVLWTVFSRRTGSTIIQYLVLGLLVAFAALNVAGGKDVGLPLALLLGAALCLSLFLAAVLCADVSTTFGKDLAGVFGKTCLAATASFVAGIVASFAATAQGLVPAALAALAFMFVVALVALGMILLRNPTWIAYELSNEPGDELESTIIEDIKRGLSENIASGFDEDAPVVEGGGVDVREFSSRVEEIAQHYDFSPRQTEIFAYLTRGHKADFIANKLFISPNTVRTHVANIYRKLEIHTHQELLNFFYGEQ